MEKNRQRTRCGNQLGNREILATVAAQQGARSARSVVNAHIIETLLNIHRTLNGDIIPRGLRIDGQRGVAGVAVITRRTAVVVNHCRTGRDGSRARSRHNVAARHERNSARPRTVISIATVRPHPHIIGRLRLQVCEIDVRLRNRRGRPGGGT